MEISSILILDGVKRRLGSSSDRQAIADITMANRMDVATARTERLFTLRQREAPAQIRDLIGQDPFPDTVA